MRPILDEIFSGFFNTVVFHVDIVFLKCLGREDVWSTGKGVRLVRVMASSGCNPQQLSDKWTSSHLKDFRYLRKCIIRHTRPNDIIHPEEELKAW
jgi:hypothetical protein